MKGCKVSSSDGANDPATHFAHREMKAQPTVMHYMTHSMMPLCDIIQGNVTNLFGKLRREMEFSGQLSIISFFHSHSQGK